MKKIRFQFLLPLLFIGCTASNQLAEKDPSSKSASKKKEEAKDEYFEKGFQVLKNKTYEKEVKTVWIHKKGWNLSNPAIELKAGEILKFSFDRLSADLGDYYYTIIHCDADWKKSDLMETQYIKGFFQDFIQSFKFSFNTYEQYIHYELELPNKNMQFKITGNYIFKVFKDNDPDQVVLTRRFQVYENKVLTKAKANRPSNIQERNYKQEIDFEIDLQKLTIPDINRDIKVVIQQNNRWDNAITDLKPLFVRGNQLIYDYNNMENVFDGGNEYRFLDIRNMRFRGQKIQQILLANRRTDAYLFAEDKRRFKNYLFYEDLDGKFIIKNQHGVDQRVESDYIHVHFALNYPQKLTDGDVYVFGGLTDNEFQEEFKMTYNALAKQYEVDALIKQGYYDYQFMFKKKLEDKGDITIMEGDHFQTENIYSITTYFRDPSCSCDKIIGYHTFKSNQPN